jgi:HEPN domain-containing protein
MYYLLTESFKEQEKRLVEIILECVTANKIYLLGSSLSTRRTESVFMPDAPSCRKVEHYDVLVLVSSNEDKNAVQDKIENRCRHFIPVTAIVLVATTFAGWLAADHRFALTVSKRAVLLHGLAEPDFAGNELPPGGIKEENKKLYNDGCSKVTEFIAGAELYIIRKQTKLAAFMLHQATEQALHTMFELHTGMYLNTHNLDKLIRYCSMVSYRLPEIFPGINEKQVRLFQLLKDAYTGGRYKADYVIHMDELAAIKEKVYLLQQILTR